MKTRETHGETRGRKLSPEYMSWKAMIARCTNRKSAKFPMYGGRGIKVCDEWRNSFAVFLECLGRKPTGRHTLDRFPNKNGHYEPGNVRWATAKDQGRNTRRNKLITVGDVSATAAEWSEKTGVSRFTIIARIANGWPAEKAINFPAKVGQKVIKATHCSKGHEFNADNTVVRGTRRECVVCSRARALASYYRKKGDR